MKTNLAIIIENEGGTLGVGRTQRLRPAHLSLAQPSGQLREHAALQTREEHQQSQRMKTLIRPLRESHSAATGRRQREGGGKGPTDRDERILHPASPVGVILAANLIALLHAFPTGQTRAIGICGRVATPALWAAADIATEGGVARGAGGGEAEVDAGAGVVLSAGVGGEDLDGVVDAGDGEEGFVGVAWWGK